MSEEWIHDTVRQGLALVPLQLHLSCRSCRFSPDTTGSFPNLIPQLF